MFGVGCGCVIVWVSSRALLRCRVCAFGRVPRVGECAWERCQGVRVRLFHGRFAGSCVDMVSVSRVVLLACAVGQSAGQSAWQAGEPVPVNIDYDVPALGAEDAAALVQENLQLEARLGHAVPVRRAKHKRGFSAAAVRSERSLVGDAVPPEDVDVVVHVPAPAYGPAQEAAFLDEVGRQVELLSGLAAKQRSQENRVLRGASGLARRAVAIGRSHGSLAADEPVAEVEASDGLGQELRGLVAETEAGGNVARRALEELVSIASLHSARSAILASGAARAAATLLKRPSTDEATRALAGSLLTLLSGMPLAAEVSDEMTGSDGHVEIILPRPSRVYGPDAVAMQLSAGVSPSHVEA